MRLHSQTNRLRSITISFVSRFLALLVISSFAVAQFSIVSTLAEDSSMPCCAGKTEGHCDSGLAKPKPRPVITEPMCGLKWSPPLPTKTGALVVETDPVSVDADAVEKDCQMDCGAYATATPRHKRQKQLIPVRVTHHAPATITTGFDDSVLLSSSNDNWTQISPRGPPVG